jgi:hypothetical protein
MPETRAAAAVAARRAVVFDLFHTLTSLESVIAAGPMTHEIESLRELVGCASARPQNAT